MSFCDIVVDATPRPDLDRTLDRARELAGEFGAHLSVVSYAWPRASIADALTINAFTAQEQTRAMEEALAAARNAFDRAFGPTPKGLNGVAASATRPKPCATTCWPPIC